ncbi:MAG: DUF523 domain-containing protein [Candidatus Omnitrophica bacterium]|nr:DUF523 domain-containing protein [Candidatus Omnitrophota bacterium]
MINNTPSILVSACLTGRPCAYDGKARRDEGVIRLCERYGHVAICPEMMGGLPCPRERNEIQEGSGSEVVKGKARVTSSSGKDNTSCFMKGAKLALRRALAGAIKIAILKQHSPSCSNNVIHDGTFSGRMINGKGVTAALLVDNGIKVFNEDEVLEAERCLSAGG